MNKNGELYKEKINVKQGTYGGINVRFTDQYVFCRYRTFL